MYQDIYNRTEDDYTKAQMDYLIGQAYTASGQIDLAYTAYQDAVNNFPKAYELISGAAHPGRGRAYRLTS